MAANKQKPHNNQPKTAAATYGGEARQEGGMGEAQYHHFGGGIEFG